MVFLHLAVYSNSENSIKTHRKKYYKCIKKLIKNRCKIDQKSSWICTYVFVSILAPFWHHFGSILLPWAALGCLRGASGATLGCPWVPLGSPGGSFGVISGDNFGEIWSSGYRKGPETPSRAIWGRF